MPGRKAKPTQRPITAWEKAPQLMETDYAALLLGIAPDTLRRMARRGDVPAKRLGRKLWRFEKSELMAWTGATD